MIDALKNWLPITIRNRVALGFAFVALVIFVTWNFWPGAHKGDKIVAVQLWPNLFSLDHYINVYKSPDIDGLRACAVCTSLILNGLVILAIVPFWKVLHASNYIKLPLAILNMAGGFVVLWYVVELIMKDRGLYGILPLSLVALSMLALSASLFIFKNELGLRHDLEVKKTMNGE